MNVKLIRIKSRIFRKLPLRFFFEQIVLPIIVLKNKVEIIHSLHYSFPLACFFAKRIVTVHDLTFFKYPQYHLRNKIKYFKFFITIAHLFANKIIVVSESTKRDLLSFTRTKKNKIKTICLGCVDPDYEIRKKDIQTVKRKYGLPDQFMLYLGMIEPRKNIGNLIKAFEKVSRHRNLYHLVIAGKIGWNCQNIRKLIEQLKNFHLPVHI